MKDQELCNLWKGASTINKINFDMKELLSSFKTKMERGERRVRNRDRREIAGAILGIFGCTAMASLLPLSVGTIGLAIIVISLLYSIHKLRKNRKSKLNQKLFLSLEEELTTQQLFLKNQAKLLNTVLYWMVLPMFVGYLIFIWGFEPYDTADESIFLPTSYLGKTISCLVMLGYSLFVVRLNKRAVKENWKPLLEDISRIIDNLKRAD